MPDKFKLTGFVACMVLVFFAAGDALPARGGHSPVDTDGDGRGAACERGNARFCDDVSSDDGSTDDESDDGSTDDESDDESDDGSTDDGSTDDGSTDDGSTDDGSTDDESDSGDSDDSGSNGIDDGSSDDSSKYSGVDGYLGTPDLEFEEYPVTIISGAEGIVAEDTPIREALYLYPQQLVEFRHRASGPALWCVLYTYVDQATVLLAWGTEDFQRYLVPREALYIRSCELEPSELRGVKTVYTVEFDY